MQFKSYNQTFNSQCERSILKKTVRNANVNTKKNTVCMHGLRKVYGGHMQCLYRFYRQNTLTRGHNVKADFSLRFCCLRNEILDLGVFQNLSLRFWVLFLKTVSLHQSGGCIFQNLGLSVLKMCVLKCVF